MRYAESQEVNEDRQYADYCLDNNGKSIIEERQAEKDYDDAYMTETYEQYYNL